jgi:hypothetical protein
MPILPKLARIDRMQLLSRQAKQMPSPFEPHRTWYAGQQAIEGNLVYF